jgi:hypothetical protein
MVKHVVVQMVSRQTHATSYNEVLIYNNHFTKENGIWHPNQKKIVN